MARAPNPLPRLRKLLARFPETHERLSHGSPTWWGGRKTFVRYVKNSYTDGRATAWIKSTHEAQEAMVAHDPALFFVPPYAGPSGWVGVYLDGKLDWELLAGLLEEGYRMVAPQRALRALDALKNKTRK